MPGTHELVTINEGVNLEILENKVTVHSKVYLEQIVKLN